jgi:hypothetical protein
MAFGKYTLLALTLTRWVLYGRISQKSLDLAKTQPTLIKKKPEIAITDIFQYFRALKIFMTVKSMDDCLTLQRNLDKFQ